MEKKGLVGTPSRKELTWRFVVDVTVAVSNELPPEPNPALVVPAVERAGVDEFEDPPPCPIPGNIEAENGEELPGIPPADDIVFTPALALPPPSGDVKEAEFGGDARRG